jgi:ribose/xylose/arabinose/galactoside ABC-type transport system permease subunit
MSAVAPGATTEKAAPVVARIRRGVPLSVLGVPIVVAAIVIVGAVQNADFLTTDNLRAVLLSASITGIVAVSMTAITMSGSFVSLASSQSIMLAAILFAAMIGAGWNVALAILAVVAALALTGLAQGLIVAAGLNPVITTLAAGAIIFGGVSIVSGTQEVAFGGRQISWLTDSQPLGLPLPIYVFVAVTAIVSFLIHRTVLGRHIVLTGANRNTARVSGIPVRTVTTMAFVILAAGTAVAGILAVSRVGSADPRFMESLTVDAIAALLIGGTSVAGGQGSPLRSAMGALSIALIDNIMILNDFSAGGRQTIKGIIVVAVVILVTLLARKESR